MTMVCVFEYLNIESLTLFKSLDDGVMKDPSPVSQKLICVYLNIESLTFFYVPF